MKTKTASCFKDFATPDAKIQKSDENLPILGKGYDEKVIEKGGVFCGGWAGGIWWKKDEKTTSWKLDYSITRIF